MALGALTETSTAIGLIGIGYNEIAPLPGVTGPDGNKERIFLALTTALFHPVFSGFVLAAVLALGCSQETPPAKAPNASNASASVDGSRYLLDAEPEGAAGVIKARKDTEDDAEIVVVGRIGGSENPWVEGQAAFTIVDECR